MYFENIFLYPESQARLYYSFAISNSFIEPISAYIISMYYTCILCTMLARNVRLRQHMLVSVATTAFILTCSLILLFRIGYGNIYLRLYPANCSCSMANPTQVSPSENASTCSDDRARHTLGQNVISFSYFEPPEVSELRHAKLSNYTPNVYFIGILENLKKMRRLYPGFVMRVYSDVPLEGELCSLHCNNPDLHWCYIRQTPSHGDLSSMFFMTWRFLPLADPTVNLFLSRDLDSILTKREREAVSDWLKKTNMSINTMRDNVAHNVQMLGGAWGASNRRLVDTIGAAKTKQLQSTIIEESKKEKAKGFDQDILTSYVHFPLAQHIVTYDSYRCRHAFTLVRPFPVRRRNSDRDFVGNTGLGRDRYDLQPCPVECRPTYGKHWTHC